MLMLKTILNLILLRGNMGNLCNQLFVLGYEATLLLIHPILNGVEPSVTNHNKLLLTSNHRANMSKQVYLGSVIKSRGCLRLWYLNISGLEVC